MTMFKGNKEVLVRDACFYGNVQALQHGLRSSISRGRGQRIKKCSEISTNYL